MHFFIQLIKQKNTLLIVYAILIAICAFQALDLKFDHARSRFFPANDEDLEFTNYFFEEIELDDIYVLAALEFEEDVTQPRIVKLLDSLGGELEKQQLIVEVSSIANAKKLKKAGPSLYQVPVVRGNAAIDSQYIAENPYLYKRLVSKDFKGAALLVKTKIIDNQEKADSVYFGIKKVLASAGAKSFHMGGFPVMQSVTVRELGNEMTFYVSLSGGLLLIILFVIYRSFWGLVVPFISLVGGTTFFFAYLQLSGQSLDLMSSLFPILMLIFLMADVVHLQTHYIDQLSDGLEPLTAMRNTVKEIGLALFLTSFTTAVGFGTLVTSRIEAIRHFGINASVGVLIAFFCVILFASSMLLFFRKEQLIKTRKARNGWERRINAIFYFNKQRYRLIAGVTVVALLVASYGIGQISTNAYIKGDIPNKAKLRSDFDYFEKQFGGVRAIELAILPQGNLVVNDPKVLKEVAELESYLVDSHAMNGLISPTLPYKILHEAYTRGRSKYELPQDEATLKKYESLLAAGDVKNAKLVANESGTLGRISGRQLDQGSDFHEEQSYQIQEWVNKHIDQDVVQFKVTGTTLMYDRNHEYLRKSLFKSLGLAFIIVGILFAILFKDWRMVLISLVPNMVPLFLSAALMGFLNIKLQALTSIFFAISFGIAVDDTIHFLTRYKLERKKGMSVDKAIKSTLHISGKAIIITSIILVVSFISLTFSDFRGTYYIGVLVSITLFSAILADLFLLPQLLYGLNRLILKSKRKKR